MPETRPYIKVYTPVPDSGVGLSSAEKQGIFDKLRNVDNILVAVIVVLVVAVITMLFMAVTLLIDSFHFNSATYKEYSEKTTSVETTQKANEVLLTQIKDIAEQGKQDREIFKKLLNSNL